MHESRRGGRQIIAGEAFAEYGGMSESSTPQPQNIKNFYFVPRTPKGPHMTWKLFYLFGYLVVIITWRKFDLFCELFKTF